MNQVCGDDLPNRYSIFINRNTRLFWGDLHSMDTVDAGQRRRLDISLDFNLTEVLRKLVGWPLLTVVDEEGYFQWLEIDS